MTDEFKIGDEVVIDPWADVSRPGDHPAESRRTRAAAGAVGKVVTSADNDGDLMVRIGAAGTPSYKLVFVAPKHLTKLRHEPEPEDEDEQYEWEDIPLTSAAERLKRGDWVEFVDKGRRVTATYVGEVADVRHELPDPARWALGVGAEIPRRKLVINLGTGRNPARVSFDPAEAEKGGATCRRRIPRWRAREQPMGSHVSLRRDTFGPSGPNDMFGPSGPNRGSGASGYGLSAYRVTGYPGVQWVVVGHTTDKDGLQRSFFAYASHGEVEKARRVE